MESAADIYYPGLTPQDRVLGYVAWQLLGDWKSWVRRRVESITYETSHSVRRRVSVDLRLIPSLFGNPIVEWGGEQIHYVPIAQLRKQRLIRFDLRDEQDHALPLITKHRNASITAAMLTAAAQAVIAMRINDAELGLEITRANVVHIPEALERSFWMLAFLNPTEPGSTSGGARGVFEKFRSAGEVGELPLARWGWHFDGDRRIVADVSTDDWYALLGRDAAFVRLAWDVSRLFIICAPLPYEPGRRRIVKFSYTDYLGQAAGPTEWVKTAAARMKLARAWNRWEDWLEGLPGATTMAPDEWVPSLSADQPPRVPLRRKIFEVIGWTTQIGKFETPAVGHGSSYHLEISTPEGIQIRRAQLVTLDHATQEKVRHLPQRGNRALHTVDLHVSQMPPSHTGNTYLNIRPESSLIVRAGFCTSALTAAALTLLWIFASRLTSGESSHVEAVAVVLIVLPGLLTVLATRDVEHPLATNMVFGLRVLAMVPGVLAFLAAGQVIEGDPGSWIGIVLFALAWSVTAVLGVGWRLSVRGRPHPTAL